MSMFRSLVMPVLAGFFLIGFSACKSQFEAAELLKNSGVQGDADARKADAGTQENGEDDENLATPLGGTNPDASETGEIGTQQLDPGLDPVEADEASQALDLAVSDYFGKVGDRPADLLENFYQPQIFFNGEDAHLQVVVTEVKNGLNYCFELAEQPEGVEARNLLPVPGDLCEDPQELIAGAELKLDVACLEGNWELCDRYGFLLYVERLDTLEILNHVVYTAWADPLAEGYGVPAAGLFPVAEKNNSALKTFADYIEAKVDETTETATETKPGTGTEIIGGTGAGTGKETPTHNNNSETDLGASDATESDATGGGNGHSNSGSQSTATKLAP